MPRNTYKGIYKPKNPQKYKGDSNEIIFRSSWERAFMCYLDNHPNIIEWSSEGVIIPYHCPVRQNMHRYFVDFWIKKRTVDDIIECDLIEIKPFKETQPPESPYNAKTRKKRRRLIQESQTFAINMAKWEAAKAFCKKRGWNFKIFTEKELGLG